MTIELKKRTPEEQQAYWTRILAEYQSRIAELEKDCALLLDELTETRSSLRARVDGIHQRGVKLLQEKDLRISKLEMMLQEGEKFANNEVRRLEETNREQARTIMRLITNRNYLQAEVDRLKEKP